MLDLEIYFSHGQLNVAIEFVKETNLNSKKDHRYRRGHQTMWWTTQQAGQIINITRMSLITL